MKDRITGLDFHQTFKPERNCINSLLSDISECSGKTIADISKITGIPAGKSSGKVLPTICYAEYMGLIHSKLSNGKYILDYTDIGKVVVDEDPGLSEELTLLLLHCMLVRKNSGALLWAYIICDLLPKYHNEINKLTLEKELSLRFKKDVNVAPFNGTYMSLFQQLDVVEIQNSFYIVHSHLYNSEFIYLYGLVLYEYWEDWVNSFDNKEQELRKISLSEITAEQIEETGFRHPFGWSKNDEYAVLEALNDKGVIALNRQMSPFAVRKIMKKENLIDQLYSELC